jgi:hypothetical protein
LIDAVKARIEALKAADPTNTAPIPVDLVTASASGLDPHISVAAANYQLERVARARELSAPAVAALDAAPEPPSPETATLRMDPAPASQIDWIAVGLGLLAFVAVGGLIPLWLFIALR